MDLQQFCNYYGYLSTSTEEDQGYTELNEQNVIEKKQQTCVRVGVGVIVYNKKYQTILMSRRKDNQLMALPGGHLELYEQYYECASREIKEECGLDIQGQSNFVTLTVMNCFRSDINYHYIISLMACSYNGDKIYNLEPHKHEDWKWFSWKEIVEFNENNELFYGLADYIDNILSQNKTLIGILEVTV